MNRHTLLIIVALSLSISGCNFPLAADQAPEVTLPPILVITSTPDFPPPTPILPTEIDLEFIQLNAPGPQSRVGSPLIVSGFSLPTFEQNLVITITDANGALLALQPATIQAELGSAGPFESSLIFTVTEEQPGRVSVYYASPRDGGLVHLSSAMVTLVPGSDTLIQPAPSQDEEIQIGTPDALAVISGGTLEFSGSSVYFFEANLVVALCGAGGSGAPDPVCGTQDNLLALTTVIIDSPDMGQPGTFVGTISYAVSQETPARLAIYAASPMDGGLEHLSSVEVVLLP